MQTINRPVPFSGTEEQKQANRLSHWGIEGRCDKCDCNMHWGEVRNYPCGQEPPRETVEVTIDSWEGISNYPDFNDSEREDH